MDKSKEYVNTNLKRLKQIQNKINTENVTSLAQLKEVGGAAVLYSLLNSNNIIQKKGDKYIWNPSIPVTHTLASTLTDTLRERAISGKNIGTKTFPKAKVINPKSKVKKDKIVKTISTTYVPKIKEKVHNIAGFSFSLAWGLLRLDKFK